MSRCYIAVVSVSYTMPYVRFTDAAMLVEYTRNARYGDIIETELGAWEFVEVVLRTGLFQPPWRINIVATYVNERGKKLSAGLSFELKCEPSLFREVFNAVLSRFLSRPRNFDPNFIVSVVYGLRLRELNVTIYPASSDMQLWWHAAYGEDFYVVHDLCDLAPGDPIKVELIDKNERKYRQFKKRLIELLRTCR